jgi:hypothetical protein
MSFDDATPRRTIVSRHHICCLRVALVHGRELQAVVARVSSRHCFIAWCNADSDVDDQCSLHSWRFETSPYVFKGVRIVLFRDLVATAVHETLRRSVA